MKFFYQILLFSLSCLLLSSCVSQTYTIHRQAFVFGTLVDITVLSRDKLAANQAINDVLSDFDKLHHILHPWKSPSELVDVNKAIHLGKPIKVSYLMRNIILDMQRYEVQTKGLFNPSIGLLTDLWGFHADQFKSQLPDRKKVLFLRDHHPSMSDVHINNKNILTSSNRFVSIDDGGYAKGLALDRAMIILKKHGIKNALINIGGNIVAAGSNEGDPWLIGIRDPESSGVFAVIKLYDGEAIGTSGNYHRYFDYKGVRYCHVINPFLGYPPLDVESATVLISKGLSKGVRSDVLSKPIFLSPYLSWLKVAKTLGIKEVARVGSGHYEMTDLLRKRAVFIDKKVKIVTIT